MKKTDELKKPELVKKMVKSLTSEKSSGASGKSSGGKRTGKKASKSLDYSQEITSTRDRPERPGRSLVTTDHEVIRQWAKARRAVPATVAGRPPRSNTASEHVASKARPTTCSGRTRAIDTALRTADVTASQISSERYSA